MASLLVLIYDPSSYKYVYDVDVIDARLVLDLLRGAR